MRRGCDDDDEGDVLCVESEFVNDERDSWDESYDGRRTRPILRSWAWSFYLVRIFFSSRFSSLHSLSRLVVGGVRAYISYEAHGHHIPSQSGCQLTPPGESPGGLARSHRGGCLSVQTARCWVVVVSEHSSRQYRCRRRTRRCPPWCPRVSCAQDGR